MKKVRAVRQEYPIKEPLSVTKPLTPAHLAPLEQFATVTSQNALQLRCKGHVAYNPGSHYLVILNSGEFLMEQHIKITETEALNKISVEWRFD